VAAPPAAPGAGAAVFLVICGTKGNVATSPVSLEIALSMAAAGDQLCASHGACARHGAAAPVRSTVPSASYALRVSESWICQRSGRVPWLVPVRTQTLLSWARPWLLRVLQNQANLAVVISLLLRKRNGISSSHTKTCKQCSHHFFGVHIVSARTLVHKDLARSPLPGQRMRRHPTILYLFRFVSYNFVLLRSLPRCIVSSRFVSYVSLVS